MSADELPDEPYEIEITPNYSEDSHDFDYEDLPCTDGAGDGDDARWEAFIPDDDEVDPAPDPGDFWIESSGQLQVAA